MGETYRVTHCFQGNGGTTQDTYCNQFHFFSVAKTPATVETWGPVLANYIHQLFVLGTPSVSRFYHPRCSDNGGITKIYDAGISGSDPVGAPIFTITDETLVPGTDYLADLAEAGDPLPEEVAVCLSYQAAHTEGNLPRRRGRIYLGPLNVNAIDTDVSPNQPTRVSDVFINTILSAATLVQEGAASYDMEWRVYSPSDGFGFKIINFSVDNAFDTVRGRGQVPSYRTTVPIT